MKHSLLHKSLLAGFLAIASGYSMQASALPNFEFSFHQESGFLANAATPTGTPGNNIGWWDPLADDAGIINPPADTFHTLAWGVDAGGAPIARGLLAADPIGDANKSALKVIGHTGSMFTGGPLGMGSDWGAWVAISTVMHQNNPIPIVDALSTAVILSNLHFDDAAAPATIIHTDNSGVGITFTETLNLTPCDATNNPLGSVCDDRFGFQVLDFAPISFKLNGHKYEVEFGVDNFINSATDFPNCDVNPNQCTVWTAEGVTSSMDVIARVRQVPEPATLALLGIGLLGLGLTKRRELGV